MKTKIQITPAMRQFNEAVETADVLTDYAFDREPASVLLTQLNQEAVYPHSVRHLAEAIAALAIKR